jgi:hypothetical protein
MEVLDQLALLNIQDLEEQACFVNVADVEHTIAVEHVVGFGVNLSAREK